MLSKILRTSSKSLRALQNGSVCSVIIRKKSVWTQEGIIKSPYETIDIPNVTLYHYVWHNLDKWPERTMAVCAQTGRGYTYEQAFKLSHSFAANLRKKLKIKDGDTVMIMLPNVPDYPLVAMGILEAGGVISTVNPIYTPHEVQRQIISSDTKAIVTLPDLTEVVKQALKLAKVNIPIIVVKTNGEPIPEGTIAFNELSEDVHADLSCLKQVRRDPKDICFLPYSSGTTGLPKGVELTHRNIVANCEQISAPIIRMHEDTTESHQDVVLAVLPFFHIYAATVLMFHKMRHGIKVVTLAKFQPEVFLHTLEKYKVNWLFVAPPLVMLMANHPLASAKIFRHIDNVINGAAGMAASDVERFLDKIQRKIRYNQGYGLTETSPAVALGHRHIENYDIVGNALPNTEMKIVDLELKSLRPNQMGEILVRGPQVMKGYRNNPDANADSLTEDGWFRTGDMGVVDEQGMLKICDRLKELIKICGVTDRKYTYLELYRQSQIFGASLRKKFKVKDGDVVTVMLPNCLEYPIVVLGILTAGGVASTINPVYTVYEAQKQISTSEAKLIVTNPENVDLVKEVLKQSKLNIPVIAVDIDKERPQETVSFKELIHDSHVDKDILKEVKRSTQDTSLLLYSSGTTGLPKAVELTNRNIVANCEQQNGDKCRKFNDTTETNQDTALAYLPMFHCYGLSVVTIHKLSVGLKLVILPRFHPNTFVTALEKHKFDLMFVAPPTVLFLASSPLVNSKHFAKLQNVITGAAPLPQADVERFLGKIDHEVHFGQVYGCTEAGPVVTITPNGCKDYGTVGFALPNSELRVVDSEMNNLGPNELGELLIKGPNVMKGYKNNPQANSQAFAEGWLKSGDLAKIDEHGYVTIADRLKELIKVNAYQVPPAELENIIREHPAVFDAAVVGIPDDKTGEKPKAFVVLNKDSKASQKDIMEYVCERVAPYKRLKEVQFLDVIPKNPSGKILRRVLKGN